MTTAHGTGTVPLWTIGDRLRKAREFAGLEQTALAEAMGVTRKTVSDAERNKRAVRKITLNAWALATGVSRDWLENGEAPGPGSPDGALESNDRAQSAPSGTRTPNPLISVIPSWYDQDEDAEAA